MNLRDIKKDIDYVLGAFVDDCCTIATVNPVASDEALSNLFDEAINLYNEFRDKATGKQAGNKRAYFFALRCEILAKTDALYEKLSEIVKASVAGK